MQIPNGTTIAVADGAKLKLYQNNDSNGGIKLLALPDASPDEHNAGSGARHENSAANHGQPDEDNFAAGVASLINKRVQSGKINKLVIVAAPRALGEMRKHYSKETSHALLGELAKDLTGEAIHDIEQSLQKAA